jgi:hypothetical protein
VNTFLLVLLCGGLIIFAKIVFARLAVIHALTNSGMGASLSAQVTALRSDAQSKRQLAGLIRGTEYIGAADAADAALRQAEDILQRHMRGQGQADRDNNKKFFK